MAIQQNNKILSQWKESVIKLIHNKWNKTICSNQLWVTIRSLNDGPEFDNQITDKMSYQQLLIDCKQAYASIRRVEIWNSMSEVRILKKLIRPTRSFREGWRNAVRVGEKISIFFAVNSGKVRR